MIKAAAQIADVTFRADKENGHLEGSASDDNQTDDVALLLGQRLVGLTVCRYSNVGDCMINFPRGWENEPLWK